MNRKKKLNKLGLNDCFMDKKNPFELFKVWMSKAEKTEINDPNALALATVNSKKQPSVRMVLLKGLTSKEFIFYTNLNSRKSSELTHDFENPLCFADVAPAAMSLANSDASLDSRAPYSSPFISALNRA